MTERIAEEKRAYLQASEEVDAGTQDKGLWIKALALTQGNEEQARHQYVRLRAEELYSEPSARVSTGETATGIRASAVERLSTPENLRWLYRLLLIGGLFAGFTPVLFEEPEIPTSAFFTIAAVIVGVRFLLLGQRVRFTVCLLLAALINPWFFDLASTDELFFYCLASYGSLLLLILHGDNKHYPLFRRLCLAHAVIGIGVLSGIQIQGHIDKNESRSEDRENAAQHSRYFTDGDGRFDTLSGRAKQFYDELDLESRDLELDKREVSMWIALKHHYRYTDVYERFSEYAGKHFDSVNPTEVYYQISKIESSRQPADQSRLLEDEKWDLEIVEELAPMLLAFLAWSWTTFLLLHGTVFSEGSLNAGTPTVASEPKDVRESSLDVGSSENETPRRKQRGIKDQSDSITSPQSTGSLPKSNEHDQIKKKTDPLLSELTPKKAWSLYVISALIAIFGFTAGYRPLVEIASGVGSITVFVAALCTLGRLTQAVFKWSAVYLKAACLWAIIPLVHVAILACVFALHDRGLITFELTEPNQPSKVNSNEIEYERVWSQIEAVLKDSTARHLEKWAQLEPYVEFNKENDLDMGIQKCAEMLVYLEGTETRLTRDLMSIERLINTSALGSSLKNEWGAAWRDVKFVEVGAQMNELEVRGVITIANIMKHLKQSAWSYSSGEYVFGQVSDGHRFDELREELVAEHIELQAFKGGLMMKLERFKSEMQRQSR